MEHNQPVGLKSNEGGVNGEFLASFLCNVFQQPLFIDVTIYKQTHVQIFFVVLGFPDLWLLSHVVIYIYKSNKKFSRKQGVASTNISVQM